MHMKHFILSAAAVFGVALSLSAADGDTFSWQGLNYRVLSETEKTCEVGDNVSASGAVVIPEKASNGSTDYTVTALGEDAFYLNVNMTSISIPETVTTIGSQALSRCIGLTDLVLPNSVKEIGTRAAYACNYLERLTISSGLRVIPKEAFSGMPWLEAIVIPDGVEVINDDAFNYCSRATSLTLGSTVKTIGKFAFAGCLALESVTIPASVTLIGEEAFGYIPKIKTVTLEEGDTELTFNINAFGNTTYLHDPDVVARIETLNLNRNFTCVSDNEKEQPFAYKPTLVTINIGGALTSLPANAFAECTDVMAVNVDKATCPAADASSFSSSTYASATLTVPAGSVDNYKSHTAWGQFKKIEGKEEELPEPTHPEKPWLISEQTLNIEAGKTAQLSATPTEEGYEPQWDITWSSSDESIATVSPEGLVTAVAAGETDIVMLVSDPESDTTYIETCRVSVTDGNAGISTVVTDPACNPAAVYDLNGRRIDGAAAPGVYIVRKSDGTTGKMIVK